MQEATEGPSAARIITLLGLIPHPEGGHYRQTWETRAKDGTRSTGTAIYFLLAEDETSHWHRVDADEAWHFYAGAPLILSMAETEQGPASEHVLGPDLISGARPQVVVPAGHWQAARSTGAWTLVGCTVSPGFRFEGFELAPPGFSIPSG
ncbi:cupin domain-containing protein [Histidinibacterium lentulum]|uniref:Cupin domain-containing protein n=1 Tax=Histidinibacterium lentulum TaxID=2480588 RepID=A0A3N2R986_9RHOB|nr:cupin domain-containing protein [Histidinibacterium lentulum]ROU04039.1 cupin domain-containing protein [Histidinibacterium lentulum]